MQRTGSRPDFRDKPHVSRTVCRRDCTCRHGNLRGDGYDTAGHQFPLFPDGDFPFQKVDGKFRGVWKWLLGFAITDEIFAVAIGHDGSISKEYFSGLISLPILGWSAGTLFGAVLGNIMPEIITTSLGIALYGMFIAVVVPKARENRHVLITVILAIIISTVIRYVPVFSGISAGFAIIISAVIASVAGAVFFPVKEAE